MTSLGTRPGGLRTREGEGDEELGEGGLGRMIRVQRGTRVQERGQRVLGTRG